MGPVAVLGDQTANGDAERGRRDGRPARSGPPGRRAWARTLRPHGKKAATPDAPQPSQTTQAGTPAGSGTTGGTGTGGGTGPVAPQPEPSNVDTTPTGGATPSADPTPTTPPPSTPEPTTTDPGTGEADAWLPGPTPASAAV